MDAFKSLRERGRTFIEQQNQQMQPRVQSLNAAMDSINQNLSETLRPLTTSTPASPLTTTIGGGAGGGAGGAGAGAGVAGSLGSVLTATISGSLSASSSQDSGIEEEEGTSVLSEAIPAPHPAMDDGTTIKTVLVRAYETRTLPAVHTVSLRFFLIEIGFWRTVGWASCHLSWDFCVCASW